MPVQGQLNPQTVQEKIQMMAGLPINILGIRLTTVHHCRWSLFMRMKHFHLFYSLKVEWVNRLLCPSNRWKVTFSLFLGCLQKEIGNQIQNNTFLQHFTHFRWSILWRLSKIWSALSGQTGSLSQRMEAQSLWTTLQVKVSLSWQGTRWSSYIYLKFEQFDLALHSGFWSFVQSQCDWHASCSR